MLHIQQVTPPLSSAKQANLKDEIAAIFKEIMLSIKAFSGELLYDFRHCLSHSKALSPPA